jgi:hypothetical protein
MAKIGRPSLYSDKLVETICNLIASGESLRKVCQRPGMPTCETIRVWLIEKPTFSAQYARAREAQADLLADEIIEIADDKSQDILDVGEGGDVRSITNSAAVQRAKLQVDARKWKAGQLAPKRWGQQSMAVTGADGGPLIVKTIIETKKIGTE